MCKTLCGVDNDILLFCDHITPAGSSFYQTADESSNGICILEKCVLETLENQGECEVIICGDINFRTGRLNARYIADNIYIALEQKSGKARGSPWTRQ